MLSLLTLLAVASAQDSPLDRIGPLKEIYQSYNDCFAATKEGKLSPDKMVELGWSRGKVEGDDPKSPIFFSRGDRAPLIMMSGQESGGGICIVMAKFKDVDGLREFLKPWGEKLPPFKEGMLSFFADGHPVMFRQAGSQKEPRLNLVVGTASGAKK